MKRFLTLLFVCLLSMSAAYAEDIQALTDAHLDSVISKASQNNNDNKTTPQKSDKPYGTHVKNIQPKRSLFTQMNIGVGFLYFDNVRGNLGGKPAVAFNTDRFSSFKNKGRLQYNRTPLFEYILGYRVCEWFKFGLSYQNQPGVAVQSQAAMFTGLNDEDESVKNYAIFTSLLNLNAIMGKIYFEMPRSLIWNNVAYLPYIGAAVGPGWQSWTENTVDYIATSDILFSQPLPLKQKISANCVWMIDAGLRIRNSMPTSNFSLTAGCKFTSWGQSRNLGLITQQNGLSMGLAKPFTVKMLYSFAPYLGFQWNFPACDYANAHSYVTDAQGRPHAFLSFHNLSENKNMIFTQLNVGAGFLLFDQVRGRLGGIPVELFTDAGTATYRDRLSYNVTPLYEYMIGFQNVSWFKYALSYQNQQNVSIETQTLSAEGTTQANAKQKLSSQLGLNAVMAKFYFQLPYYTSFFKFFSFAPYLGAGVGPGWQSWTNTVLYSMINADQGEFTSFTLPLRQNISTSCAWLIDAGIHFKSLHYAFPFNVSFGCKFNSWGQALNIGQMDQQGYGFDKGLSDPFKIRMLYSFAPYMGMQWDFPVDYNYMINKKCIMRWKPFVTHVNNIQEKSGTMIQANVGIGFLRFDKVRGNLQVEPSSLLNTEVQTSAPYKGSLKYNRTPLMEYLIGYQYNQWFMTALSYQHQGAVFVETPPLRASEIVSQAEGPVDTMKSQLELNSVMLKVYFQSPKSLVWRGWAHTPYIAAGVGPGWQSWTDTQVCYGNNGTAVVPIYTSGTVRLRQKISANAVWTVDVGLKMKNATPNCKFSILGGCKYNAWGQARSIGKIDQQGDIKLGLFKPVTIRMVYQFAPYLGVQWNF